MPVDYTNLMRLIVEGQAAAALGQTTASQELWKVVKVQAADMRQWLDEISRDWKAGQAAAMAEQAAVSESRNCHTAKYDARIKALEGHTNDHSQHILSGLQAMKVQLGSVEKKFEV